VLPNDVYHFSRGWKNAENCEGASIEYYYLINKHFELAVTPAHHLHFRSQLAPESRRHTDGVQARDSIGAIPNANPIHDRLCKDALNHGARRKLSKSTPIFVDRLHEALIRTSVL
jgi:hypothetical protein